MNIPIGPLSLKNWGDFVKDKLRNNYYDNLEKFFFYPLSIIWYCYIVVFY